MKPRDNAIALRPVQFQPPLKIAPLPAPIYSSRSRHTIPAMAEPRRVLPIRLGARSVAASLLALCLCAHGCAPTAPPGLDSPIAQERLEAAVEAAHRKDPSAVPALVTQLESDDPAVRFIAIHSLMEITGHDHGYDYAASEPDRRSAVDRWEAWVKEHHVSSDAQSSSAPSTEVAR
jgi:hypothetical protein